MSDSKLPSLKVFMLFAVLWLPICFFFWFQWAGFFVAPAGWGAEAILQTWFGENWRGFEQSGYLFVIEIYFTPQDGTRMVLNPMIYGYGLPLFCGLAIATPNAIWKRLLQIVQET